MKFAPRVDMRLVTMQQQILAALSGGPQRMAGLIAVLGVSNTPPGRQLVQRQLAALRRAGSVQRIGNRQFSDWALIGYRATGTVPAYTSRIVRRPTPTPPRPPTHSWWLVPEQQFSDAHRQRALAKQWEPADAFVSSRDE